MILPDLPYSWAEHSLKVKPILVSNVGSRAWGTNRPDSDFDIAMVGFDRELSFMHFPRGSKRRKIKCVVSEQDFEFQFCTIERFLQLISKSSFAAYENLHSPLAWGSEEIRNDLIKLFDTCYDSREILRSCIGNTVQRLQKMDHAKDDPELIAKYKKQLFRYVFVGRQLLHIAEGAKFYPCRESAGVPKRFPFMNVMDFFNAVDQNGVIENEHIRHIHETYRWAFFGDKAPSNYTVNTFLGSRVAATFKNKRYLMQQVHAVHLSLYERLRHAVYADGTPLETWPIEGRGPGAVDHREQAPQA